MKSASPKRKFKLASDGFPILDHEMSLTLVELEEKCRLTRKAIKKLTGLLQKKDIEGIRQVLRSESAGKLFPWQESEDWLQEPKELMQKYIIEPHYKLYRNEMATIAKEKQITLNKLNSVLSELINSLRNNDKAQLKKIMQKLSA